MIGILIISHEQLGASLIDCVIHILDECPSQLINHVVLPTADPNTEVTKLQTILKQLDQGDGILILTDILGATPANIASKLVKSGQVECIAGLNLPMLLRAIQYQHIPLSQLVEKVLTGAQESILRISQEIHNAD